MKSAKNIFLLFLTLIPIHIHSTMDVKMKDTEFISTIDLQKIQEELKKTEYRKEILPHDFSHFVNLIRYGNEMEQPRAYMRSVLKLFGNILKGSEYINAYVYSNMIDELISLERYFIAKKTKSYLKNTALYDASLFDRFKESINNMLYVKFSSQYESFKKDPEQFLQDLTNEIVDVTQEEISVEQLRQGIVRFLEVGLSKLVWSPED